MTSLSPFDLPVPRNATALLQHLQRLVGVEQLWPYCAGECPLTRLAPLVQKMEQRYPITRNARQRSYDRQNDCAVVHLIVYPLLPRSQNWSTTSGVFSLGNASAPNAKVVEALHRDTISSRVAWWLVSTNGRGGLADPNMPDAHVAKNAMLSNEHIEYGDYVLMQAHKKSPQQITDRRTGRTKTVLKSESTWTWKLQWNVIRK